ncbi:MAG: TlpA family protein disulfide reductase [Deltaproteobacteria bacterium]|nr:TlpA family protein disulfide reductase [Deltaproteobacteria bacterium]
MRNRCFLGVFVCLGFFLTGQLGASLPSGSRAWAQSPRSTGVNFKLVPNLEPMKEVGPTPDFTLPTPAGKKISLKNFRGKIVFLNFWASWCAPCREEMPAMERLYREFKDKGLAVLAVNVKDSRKKAVDFVTELKLSYPIVLDTDGQVGVLYGAWGLPTTYLIGRNGDGLARLWGPAPWYSPGARELMRTLLEAKG